MSVEGQQYGVPSTGAGTEVLQVLGMEKKWFEYDAVMGNSSRQEDVYRKSGALDAISNDIFKGYNVTLLAYGQTGAGKTFTMGTFGETNPEMDGILPRSCQDLFRALQEKCDGNGEVKLSYLEIYNEEIRDLLSADTPSNPDKKSPKQLKVRETMNGEVYVSGLTSQKVSSPEEIGHYLEAASKRRVVGSTAMNAVSSRSHAICTFRISGVLEGGEKFSSKLSLVDLAGSERIKKTGAQGSRRLEGIHINQSLMVLGQVVSSLSDSRSKRRPPYRDSKLTRLLQDSLGGNSRTVMVACVSPADYNVEESLNTLRYATSARNIKNTATRNLVKQITPEEAAKLQRENQLLKQQVAELQEALKKLSMAPPPSNITVVSGNTGSSDDDDDALSASLHDDTITNSADGKSSPSNTGATALTTASTTVTEKDKSTIRHLEKHIKKLMKELEVSKAELVKSTGSAAVEVPALHMEIGKLKEQLAEQEELERENEALRQELEDSKADAQGARGAAAKLEEIMEQLKELKQDEVHKRRVQLKHKVKEREWVDFIARILDRRTDQLKQLREDFELVIKVVESPAVYQTEERKGWFGKKEYKEIYDPDLREKVLVEHVSFFKDRMDEIQNDIFVRAISLQGIRDRIDVQCHRMTQEIDTVQVEAMEMETREQDVLAKLVDMLIEQPVHPMANHLSPKAQPAMPSERSVELSSASFPPTKKPQVDELGKSITIPPDDIGSRPVLDETGKASFRY